jgi:hypothetical protein
MKSGAEIPFEKILNLITVLKFNKLTSGPGMLNFRYRVSTHLQAGHISA